MPIGTLTVARLSMTLAATLLMEGCWHVPTANIQPGGPPRLIAEGIVVESRRSPGVIELRPSSR